MEKPTRVRYGVLAFCCVLSMITYLDRVCFSTVAPFIQQEFGLSETEKGWLFTAFALSYAIFEVPTGWLGDVFGPKKTLIRIVLWWSLFTATTALVVPISGYHALAFALLFLVRFLFGMGEAGAYPNIARAFHNWFPFTERASAKGTVWMAGRFAGGITTFIVLALIWETPVQHEDGTTTIHTAWRHAFFLFGALGVVWCVFFAFWFKDRPEQKTSVNQAELDLIHAGSGDEHSTERVRVPWRKLLGSRNLWILCAMYFCASYGWYFNITYLKGYLGDYYGETGGEKFTAAFWRLSFMAGMPLLLGAVACLLGGILSDSFIARTGNRRWGRRLFGVAGHGLAAVCFLGAIFADQDVWLFVFAIGFAAFFNDMMMGAAWASCLDIGKRYAGIVAGCMNTIGNLGGAAAGVLTGYIIDLSRAGLPSAAPKAEVLEVSRSGWTINFALFGFVFLLGAIFWMFFDSTTPIEGPEKGDPLAPPPTI
jgi:ACS family glucarate transporter-like MFS transporter